MKQIGVDMQAVSEYATAAECLPLRSRNSSVIIVKDEYARMDVRTELDIPIDATVKNKQPEIYTIKEVKGLEFSEVFVFDRDMSQNERYIAFTRPLKKLNVIKSLPYHTDHYESLIEQGEDDEDIDNPKESENA